MHHKYATCLCHHQSPVSNQVSVSESLYASCSIHYYFLKILILEDTTAKKYTTFLPVKNNSRLGSPLKTKKYCILYFTL